MKWLSILLRRWNFFTWCKNRNKCSYEKRRRTSTKRYALVMPYGKYKDKLLSAVPPRHAQKLLKEGKLDRPRYKWLKSGLKKYGKLSLDIKEQPERVQKKTSLRGKHIKTKKISTIVKFKTKKGIVIKRKGTKSLQQNAPNKQKRPLITKKKTKSKSKE